MRRSPQKADDDGGAGVFAEERRQTMVQRAEADGRLDAARLAESFGVSTETIRRDLIALERAGRVRRVHGGAIVESDRGAVPDLRERLVLLPQQKQAIASRALDLVPSSGVVVLDAGTTTGALAESFPTTLATTVVTPSLPIAMNLLHRGVPHVHTLGGAVDPRTGAEGGDWALAVLRELHVDAAFLGTSGISAARGATTSEQLDADIKRAVVAAAHTVVLLADSSKLGVVHLRRFAETAEVDVLVTEAAADPAELAALEQAGVRTVLA